jgi:hypothetical protein
MAAKTFDEFWKILEVPHSRQGDDYVFIKELSEVVWKAATKAAEEKFTSTNTASTKLANDIECARDWLLPGRAVLQIDVDNCILELNDIISQLRAKA